MLKIMRLLRFCVISNVLSGAQSSPTGAINLLCNCCVFFRARSQPLKIDKYYEVGGVVRGTIKSAKGGKQLLF